MIWLVPIAVTGYLILGLGLARVVYRHYLRRGYKSFFAKDAAIFTVFFWPVTLVMVAISGITMAAEFLVTWETNNQSMIVVKPTIEDAEKYSNEELMPRRKSDK